MWTEAKSTIALGLAEIVERLTAEEKREFTQLVNWEELQRLRSEVRIAATTRRVGDPWLYLQTTQDGLSLDLPLEHVPAFIAMLPAKLASQTISFFRLLIEHSQRPYEPSPEHILRRMLWPLCRGFSEIVASGTKNDAWELDD